MCVAKWELSKSAKQREKERERKHNTHKKETNLETPTQTNMQENKGQKFLDGEYWTESVAPVWIVLKHPQLKNIAQHSFGGSGCGGGGGGGVFIQIFFLLCFVLSEMKKREKENEFVRQSKRSLQNAILEYNFWNVRNKDSVREDNRNGGKKEKTREKK